VFLIQVQRLGQELLNVLMKDLGNVSADRSATLAAPCPALLVNAGNWPEMEAAIALLQQDLPQFLDKYFADAPDQGSNGAFSASSR
jgi:hypothetical protein